MQTMVNTPEPAQLGRLQQSTVASLLTQLATDKLHKPHCLYGYLNAAVHVAACSCTK